MLASCERSHVVALSPLTSKIVHYSGELDYGEVHKMCKRLRIDLDANHFQTALSQMDADGDGSITFAEFDRWWQKYGIKRLQSGTTTRTKPTFGCCASRQSKERPQVASPSSNAEPALEPTATSMKTRRRKLLQLNASVAFKDSGKFDSKRWKQLLLKYQTGTPLIPPSDYYDIVADVLVSYHDTEHRNVFPNSNRLEEFNNILREYRRKSIDREAACSLVDDLLRKDQPVLAVDFRRFLKTLQLNRGSTTPRLYTSPGRTHSSGSGATNLRSGSATPRLIPHSPCRTARRSPSRTNQTNSRWVMHNKRAEPGPEALEPSPDETHSFWLFSSHGCCKAEHDNGERPGVVDDVDRRDSRISSPGKR